MGNHVNDTYPTSQTPATGLYVALIFSFGKGHTFTCYPSISGLVNFKEVQKIFSLHKEIIAGFRVRKLKEPQPESIATDYTCSCGRKSTSAICDFCDLPF